MNRRKYIYYSIAFLMIVVMCGCAGASAPPLELPAPVTGQIDVGAPDAASKSTITGYEGAVTGGAIVLAINESAVQTSLWRVTDFLFSKAYAQTLPEACDLVGRACAKANADGSFSLQISAAVGDQIILVLISTDGEEISNRVTVGVPAGSGIQACGSGFDGALVDIANIGGTVYSLFEGTADSANKLIIGSLEFEIPGCYAKDIAAIEESAGSILIAAVSSSDNTLWIGRWNGTNLTMGLTYTLDIEPQKVDFAGSSTQVIVAGLGNSVQVDLITIADGSTTNSLTTNNANETGVTALNSIGPFADGEYLGIIVASDTAGYYLTFFLASSLTNITLNPGEIFLSASVMGFAGDDPVVVDAGLGDNTNEIRFMISDHQSIDPGFGSIRIVSGGQTITLNSNAGSFANLSMDSAYTIKSLPITSSFPQRFVQTSAGTVPTAYVLTDEGYLWRLENCFLPGAVIQSFFTITNELPDPLVIAVDETATSLTGGNAAGTTVDLSTYIP